MHSNPTKTFFSEQQRFKQAWIWILLISINLFFIYGLVHQVFLGQTFGDNEMSNVQLITLSSVVLLLTLLLLFARLDTAISKEGIYFRFFPFQWGYRKIEWNSISKAFVRQYNPITEYGGWGIRLGIFGKGKAYNVSGNKGLQLVYTSGKKILLGTQRPEEMKQALKQLGHFEL